MSKNNEYTVWDEKSSKTNIESDLLKDNNLGDSPIYYRNVSGLPRVQKFGNNEEGILSRVVAPVDIQLVTSSGGTVSETYRHGLGYKPEVIGSYHIADVGSGDTSLLDNRGMIPAERTPISFFHKVSIGSITDNELTIVVTIDGVNQGLVNIRLYLLKVNAI